MFFFIILQILILNVIFLDTALMDHSIFEESNSIDELTVHLLQKCFLQEDRTIAVIGNVPELVIKKLHLSEITALAFVGDSRPRTDGIYEKIFHSKYLYRQSFWIRLQRVVQTFVVAAPSEHLLRLALERAKTSVWWNSAAFFVVTSTFNDVDCRNAFTYLWTLWQMGILYSIFLCQENDGSLATYGYSPYHNGQSKAWRKVEVHAGRGGHPWALLKLKQVHDINICETIAFDKVERLDGYLILIGVLSIPPTLVVDDGGDDWFKKHVGEDAMIIHTVWKALNGSMHTIYYSGKNPIGFTGENETYTGFMADVSLGRVDHGMNGLWADFQWRVRSAYPHAVSGVHFLTPSKGNMPSWLKFATIYQIRVIMGMLATLLIETIFLRYVDHRPWPLTIMEIIRMTLFTAMLRSPRKAASRILLSMVFVMMLVITSGFQGSLISLLTQPTPYRNIDGIDDLLASGYDIYGYTAFKVFFDDSKLSKQFHVVDKMKSCFDGVARGDTIACVSDYMHLKSKTMSTQGCHMSMESVASFYKAYLTKLDWPLFSRFDTIVQRLFNAGITSYWREFYLNMRIREKWAKMRNTLPPNLKVLSMADLTFVFHVLIVGLFCSFAAFVIELILGCVGNRNNSIDH